MQIQFVLPNLTAAPPPPEAEGQPPTDFELFLDGFPNLEGVQNTPALVPVDSTQSQPAPALGQDLPQTPVVRLALPQAPAAVAYLAVNSVTVRQECAFAAIPDFDDRLSADTPAQSEIGAPLKPIPENPLFDAMMSDAVMPVVDNFATKPLPPVAGRDGGVVANPSFPPSPARQALPVPQGETPFLGSAAQIPVVHANALTTAPNQVKNPQLGGVGLPADLMPRPQMVPRAMPKLEPPVLHNVLSAKSSANVPPSVAARLTETAASPLPPLDESPFVPSHAKPIAVTPARDQTTQQQPEIYSAQALSTPTASASEGLERQVAAPASPVLSSEVGGGQVVLSTDSVTQPPAIMDKRLEIGGQAVPRPLERPMELLPTSGNVAPPSPKASTDGDARLVTPHWLPDPMGYADPDHTLQFLSEDDPMPRGESSLRSAISIRAEPEYLGLPARAILPVRTDPVRPVPPSPSQPTNAARQISGAEVEVSFDPHQIIPVQDHVSAYAKGSVPELIASPLQPAPRPDDDAKKLSAELAQPLVTVGKVALAAKPQPPVIATEVVAQQRIVHADTDLASAEIATPVTGFAASAPFSTQPQSLSALVPSAPMHAPSQQLAQTIVHVARNGPEGLIEIALRPEELGHIRFEMTSSGDRLHVTLVVERPEAQDLIRRNIDQLLADLRQSGFAQTSFSFGQWGQKDNRQSAGGGPAGSMLAEAFDQMETQSAAKPAVLSSGLGRLDLRL